MSVRLPLRLRAGVRYIGVVYVLLAPQAYMAYIMKGHPPPPLLGYVVFLQFSTSQHGVRDWNQSDPGPSAFRSTLSFPVLRFHLCASTFHHHHPDGPVP